MVQLLSSPGPGEAWRKTRPGTGLGISSLGVVVTCQRSEVVEVEVKDEIGHHDGQYQLPKRYRLLESYVVEHKCGQLRAMKISDFGPRAAEWGVVEKCWL